MRTFRVVMFEALPNVMDQRSGSVERVMQADSFVYESYDDPERRISKGEVRFYRNNWGFSFLSSVIRNVQYVIEITPDSRTKIRTVHEVKLEECEDATRWVKNSAPEEWDSKGRRWELPGGIFQHLTKREGEMIDCIEAAGGIDKILHTP